MTDWIKCSERRINRFSFQKPTGCPSQNLLAMEIDMNLYEFYQNACAQDAVDEVYAAAHKSAAQAADTDTDTETK